MSLKMASCLDGKELLKKSSCESEIHQGEVSLKVEDCWACKEKLRESACPYKIKVEIREIKIHLQDCMKYRAVPPL